MKKRAVLAILLSCLALAASACSAPGLTPSQDTDTITAEAAGTENSKESSENASDTKDQAEDTAEGDQQYRFYSFT